MYFGVQLSSEAQVALTGARKAAALAALFGCVTLGTLWGGYGAGLVTGFAGLIASR